MAELRILLVTDAPGHAQRLAGALAARPGVVLEVRETAPPPSEQAEFDLVLVDGALQARHAGAAARTQRLTQEKYGSLMQRAAHGIFVLDAAGSIVEANPRAAELLGLSPDALPGRSFAELLPAEEAARFRREFARLGSTGLLEITELRIPRPIGDTLWCELRASTASDDDQLVLAILRDVTEQRLAVQTIREGRHTLETIIDASPLAIIATDLHGVVTLWNRAAEQMFGWSAAEVLGASLPIVPESKWAEYDEFRDRLLRGERLSGEQTVRRTKTGALLDVSAWAAQLRDPDDGVRGIVALLADISERKLLEQQLAQAQKMEAVGKLAGGIAHDFNNMLTAITGYSDVLLEDARQPEDVRADIREIRHAASRAAALTRQLLAFSRQQVLQPEIVDVNEVIADLDKMLRRLIREDIHLALELAPDIGPVLVDASQLQQVVLNLVVNARDALPHGGRIRIETRALALDEHDVEVYPFPIQPGRHVLIAVEDNGVGMDATVRQHIFEPFYSTKSKDRGTGLGLSTAYGIVKQSGGFIDVDSELGRGTRMTVYLPVVQDQAGLALADAGAARFDRQLATPGGETVLLAEDERPLRRLIARVLRRAGYTVLEAAHPADAVGTAREHEGAIDVLITDMIMPDMGGIELARQLAALRPTLRVLFISGYAEEAIRMQGALQPGTGFVEKPFTSQQLLLRLRELLDSDATTSSPDDDAAS